MRVGLASIPAEVVDVLVMLVVDVRMRMLLLFMDMQVFVPLGEV